MQNQTNMQKNKGCLGCQSAADLIAEQMKKRKALQNKMSNKLSQQNKKKKVQDELSKASLLTYIYFVNSISEALMDKCKKQHLWDTQQLQRICFQSHSMNWFQLTGDIIGLDKSARLDCVQAVVEVIPAGAHHDNCLDCRLTATLRNSLQFMN